MGQTEFPRRDLRRMLLALAVLDSRPSTTIGEIAKQTGIDNRTVTHLLARAVEQAHVVIERQRGHYTLKDWGPFIAPTGVRLLLNGAYEKHLRSKQKGVATR